MFVGKVFSASSVFPKISSELTGARPQTTEVKPCVGLVNELRRGNVVGSTKGCVKINRV